MAWLAVLRAPWCGLSLADLELLCGTDWNQSIYEQLFAEERLSRLSDDGRTRVERLRECFRLAFARRGSAPLRDWLAGVWQQLGGPAATMDPRGLLLAEQFFAVVEQYEEGGTLADAFLLHERLGERVDQSGSAARVHVMTVYKAKGLEFDTVILPALDGTTRGDEKPLMAWHRLHNASRTDCYLAAPVEATGEDSDPVQQLIRRFEREQQRHELDRLLYVATTRARRALHLFFGLGRNKDGELAAPRQGSLLARLWPVIEPDFADWHGVEGTEESREEWVQPLIHRFPLDWQPVPAPAAIAPLSVPDMANAAETREVTFDWAGTMAQRVGSVVHRCLQYMAEGCVDGEPRSVDDAALRSMLREEGVLPEELAAAVARASQALERAATDERARWILSPAHTAAASELALSVASEGRVERIVIDRTFIDASGVRWVIDYKTSIHEGGDLDAFVESEKQRYADQLTRYQTALEKLEPARPVRAALYFPLLGVFAEY
jgi:ATP-dependent exoDNAse (exonuclease V) beta subunit